MTESLRHLASIQTISALNPIEGADRIEVARVRGWKVVVGKGEFNVGDQVVYFEIDSALPLDDPRFAFLAPRGSKKVIREDFTTFTGHVLKTIKLRGQVSQGLVMPLSILAGDPQDYSVGMDVTDELGIIKYEKPLPPELSGVALGEFDTRLVNKTDAERVQSLSDRDLEQWSHDEWVATEKIDGSSVTLSRRDDGTLRAFSRGLELVVRDDLVSVAAATRQHIIDNLPAGWTIQGEVVGPGIQSNRLNLPDVRLFVFGVFDGPHSPLLRNEWPQWASRWAVPELDDVPFPTTTDEAVALADRRRSVINPKVYAEGIVWHRRDGRDVERLGRSCFKAINNTWLLKGGD